MKRALFSVYVKDGIEDFAAFLEKQGYEIVSTGGTYSYLKKKGIKVIEVSDITGFPEVLDGRVKTLQPQIHAGILANRSVPSHLKELEEHKIEPIDFVVCNLYPFEETLKKGADIDALIEKIDIGGVTLLRAAAKNFKDVTVIVNNREFDRVKREMESIGEVPYETRLDLATQAFNHTAYYDALISNYFNGLVNAPFVSEGSVPLKRIEELRYGENPQQLAGLYRSYVDDNISILNAEVLWGKKLSYNNVMDADTALDIVREFADEEQAFVTILKHSNPCGAALSKTQIEAYEKALAGDPVSAFGGIIATNDTLQKEVASKIVERFFEIVIAPDYDDEALEILKSKKNLRILKLNGNEWTKKGLNFRRIENGFLVQEWDTPGMKNERFDIKTKNRPSESEIRDLHFAWKICKHVKSNAIVYAKNTQILGVGAGQMSRVDSARFGAIKASDAGFELKGAVLASDAFFPFRDGIDAAAEKGVSAVIQPGGSIRDKEVIDAADEHNMSMAFTGIRHFKH